MGRNRPDRTTIDRIPTANDIVRDLIGSIRTCRTVLFVGAGISRNSSVPIVGDMVPYIVDKLGVSREDQSVLFRDGSLRMPFEAFMQTLGDHTNIVQLFDVFARGTPNINHVMLAQLMRAGYVRAVVT